MPTKSADQLKERAAALRKRLHAKASGWSGRRAQGEEADPPRAAAPTLDRRAGARLAAPARKRKRANAAVDPWRRHGSQRCTTAACSIWTVFVSPAGRRAAHDFYVLSAPDWVNIVR